MKTYKINASANLKGTFKIIAPNEDVAHERACETLDDLYIPNLEYSRVYDIEILGLEEIGED